MDQEEILGKLQEAREVIGRHNVPVQTLYEFMKLYEDSIAMTLTEGSLMTYISARMERAREFQLEVRTITWRADIPARLYEFLKAYEDSVAETLTEGGLLAYTEARMDLAQDVQD